MSERAVKQRCEKAFASFLNSQRTPGTPLFSAKGIYIGQDNETIELPCVVVKCDKAEEHIPLTGYFVATLEIMVFSSIDESNANDLQEQIVGQIQSALFPMTDVRSVLNAPTDGPDTRAVRDFRVHGYFCQEESGRVTERHWIDTIVYEVHCQASD
jgi:hypothetical protein